MEGLYYPSSENKGADLRLCFRICKKPDFSQRGSSSLGETYSAVSIVYIDIIISQTWIYPFSVSSFITFPHHQIKNKNAIEAT